MKQIKYNYEPMNGYTEDDIKDINTVDLVFKSGSILTEEVSFNRWYKKDSDDDNKYTPSEALVRYINRLNKYINTDDLEWIDLSYESKHDVNMNYQTGTSSYIAQIKVIK